jgi:hypothetical protein
MKCVVPTCPETIVIEDPYVRYAHIEGYDIKRRDGGTNHVRMRRELGDFMCPKCMDKLSRKVAAGQMSLDDVPGLGGEFEPWVPA